MVLQVGSACSQASHGPSRCSVLYTEGAWGAVPPSGEEVCSSARAPSHTGAKHKLACKLRVRHPRHGATVPQMSSCLCFGCKPRRPLQGTPLACAVVVSQWVRGCHLWSLPSVRRTAPVGTASPASNGTLLPPRARYVTAALNFGLAAYSTVKMLHFHPPRPPRQSQCAWTVHPSSDTSGCQGIAIGIPTPLALLRLEMENASAFQKG